MGFFKTGWGQRILEAKEESIPLPGTFLPGQFWRHLGGRGGREVASVAAMMEGAHTLMPHVTKTGWHNLVTALGISTVLTRPGNLGIREIQSHHQKWTKLTPQHWCLNMNNERERECVHAHMCVHALTCAHYALKWQKHRDPFGRGTCTTQGNIESWAS